MSSKAKNNYHPANIKLMVLKNKIYLLCYDQFYREHRKVMTKAACIRWANDNNIHADIRDVIITAFEEGVIE